MSYDKLVKALRCCASGACDDEKCDYIGMGAYWCMIGLAQDAADAIEALQAEVKRMSVGFCKECDNHMPPLLGKVNGEVKELTTIRCPLMSSGFTQPNGWCYHFRKDGEDLFLDTMGEVQE